MEKRLPPRQISRTRPPTRQDRLVIFLMSVGLFLLLLPIAQSIHPQLIGWIVMGIVIGLPVVTINVLLPFSRWEEERCLTLPKESKRDLDKSLRLGETPEKRRTVEQAEKGRCEQMDTTM